MWFSSLCINDQCCQHPLIARKYLGFESLPNTRRNRTFSISVIVIRVVRTVLPVLHRTVFVVALGSQAYPELVFGVRLERLLGTGLE